jgi:hypothetical protein
MIIQLQVVKLSHNKVSFRNVEIESDAIVRMENEGDLVRLHFTDGTSMLAVANEQLRGFISTPEPVEEVFELTSDRVIPVEEEPPITLRPKKRRL